MPGFAFQDLEVGFSIDAKPASSASGQPLIAAITQPLRTTQPIRSRPLANIQLPMTRTATLAHGARNCATKAAARATVMNTEKKRPSNTAADEQVQSKACSVSGIRDKDLVKP